MSDPAEAAPDATAAFPMALDALEAARRALEQGTPDALNSIRRVARSLRQAGADSDVGKAAAALGQSDEDSVPGGLEALLAALRSAVESSGTAPAVVVAIPEAAFRESLCDALQRSQRRVYAAATAAEARAHFDQHEIALAVIALELPDDDGRNLLVDMRERPGMGTVPAIVLAERGDEAQAAECYALGADGYFDKPFQLATIVAAVAAELRRAADVTRTSRRDALTGLPNRAAFLEGLQRAAAGSDRTHSPLSVAMIDLDHFKGINDNYGHATGDEVLRRAGEAVGATLRATDLLARWGGEEFVALFADTPPDQAARVLERALQALRDERFEAPDGRVFTVTFSAGLAEIPFGDPPEDSLARADELLYLAKSAGRNRVLTAQDSQAATDRGESSTVLTTVLESQRRQVTVMQLSLEHLAARLSRLAASDRVDLLGRCREACLDTLERLGGHVAEDRHESMCIYFGFPVAAEDDGPRAVRAANTILEQIGELTASLDEPSNASIGLHTGTVKLTARQPMADGDTQRTAVRLQAQANPGSVVLSATTASLVQGFFTCEEIGTRLVSRPMAVYRVVKERSAHFDMESEKRLSPMAGRQSEMLLLQERWSQAVDGMGQVVLLSGEAGIGKSRLLQAVRSDIANVPHTFLGCRCSPYHRHSAFYPLVGQLRQVFGLEQPDDGDVDPARLSAALESFGLVPGETVPLLASLLGLSLTSDDLYPAPGLTPQQHKQRTQEMLLSVVLALAAREPVLLIVEDLHWIDPSTLEFLSLLIDQAPTLRLFVLCTFRPSFASPWGNRAHLNQLNLNRLSLGQVDEMLQRITGGRLLPVEVRDELLSRTDGVPLFVEEMTKMVLESGMLELRGDSYVRAGHWQELAIPTTIQDSLMARLDRLGSAKPVAQIGAVFGRTFSYAAMLEVAALEEPALLRELERLVAAELVYQHNMPPRASYTFKHALIQDTAYQSLTGDTRKQYHALIAEALESAGGDAGRGAPELLAHHFGAADLPARAFDYLLLAGDTAVARYSSQEARAHYQQALDTARGLDGDADSAALEISAVLKLASVAANREHFESDLRNLDRARGLLGGVDQEQHLAQVHYWTGRTHYVLGDYDRGVEFAQKALQLGDRLGGDDTVTSGPVNLLARIHCLRGEARSACEHAARNAVQMRRLGNRMEEAAILGVLAFGHGLCGQLAEALVAADRGVDLARDVEHLPTLAACYMYRGVANGWFGELAPAADDFERGIRICDEANDVFRKYVCLGWRGEAYLFEGEIELAEADLLQCLAIGDQIGTSFHRGAYEAFMAQVRLLKGDLEGARYGSERAVQIAEDAGQAWSLSLALRARADVELHLDGGDLSAAMQRVQTAIALQRERECVRDLAWSQLLLGRLHSAVGDSRAAREVLEATHLSFDEIGIARGRNLAGALIAELPAPAAAQQLAGEPG